MMIRRLSRRRFVFVAGGLVASQAVRPVMAQVATPVASPPALDFPSLTIEATDHGLQIPPSTTAGRVLATLVNHSKQPAQAIIMVQPANVSTDELVSAFTQMPKVPPTWFYDAHFTGGPDVIPPGGQSQVIIDLAPGRYVAINPPKQITTFTVSAGPGGTPATVTIPPANGHAILINFAFELPLPVAAGRVIWRADNPSNQPHMMDLSRVPAGTTLKQVLAFLERPENATPAPGSLRDSDVVPSGGLTLVSPGVTSWPVLELEEGRYMASCSAPDPKTGKPHFALGMVAVFDVGAATPPAAS